eukprot:12102759-Alexandrium_andersonii.AAC.1
MSASLVGSEMCIRDRRTPPENCAVQSTDASSDGRTSHKACSCFGASAVQVCRRGCQRRAPHEVVRVRA